MDKDSTLVSNEEEILCGPNVNNRPKNLQEAGPVEQARLDQ